MPAANPSDYIGTNWVIRASFSSFVFNVLGYLGGHGQMQDPAGLRPGGTMTLEPPDPQAVVTVRPPAGKPVVLGRAASGRCNFTATNELGIYEAQANGKTFQRFAVNLFDPLESDIRPAKDPAIKIGHETVHGQTGWEAANREIWKELLLLGLAVSLLEWYIYTRRVHY